MKDISRRSLLLGVAGGVTLATVGDFRAPGAKAAAPEELIGTPPSAAAHASHYGDWLHTLHSYQGRVYYGYGDYGSNSGTGTGLGCDVAYFDPSGHYFGVDYPAHRSEAIEVLRTFNDRLYVPNIDLTYGSIPAVWSSLYVTNQGGWRNVIAGPHDAIHVYDTLVLDSTGDWVLACGSMYQNNLGTAMVLESQDAGATWSILFADSDEATNDGFERVYWMAKVGDSAYFRPNLGGSYSRVAPMYRYNLLTRELTEVPRNMSIMPNTGGGTILTVTSAGDEKVTGKGNGKGKGKGKSKKDKPGKGKGKGKSKKDNPGKGKGRGKGRGKGCGKGGGNGGDDSGPGLGTNLHQANKVISFGDRVYFNHGYSGLWEYFGEENYSKIEGTDNSSVKIVTVGGDGNLYYTNNDRLYQRSPSGSETVLGNTITGAQAMVVQGDHVYYARGVELFRQPLA